MHAFMLVVMAYLASGTSQAAEVDPVVWTAYGVEEVKVVSVLLR